MSEANETLGNRIKIPVAEGDQRDRPLLPFRSEFISAVSWGSAETAPPQALMSVAFGDQAYKV